MKLLIDTHAYIWFINGDDMLGNQVRELIENPDNTIYVSIASLWEMAIKISLGKLEISQPFENIITYIFDNGFELLPVSFEHTAIIRKLEFYHRDPFDRMLIAQALYDDLSVITKDTAFDSYNIRRVWHP